MISSVPFNYGFRMTRIPEGKRVKLLPIVEKPKKQSSRKTEFAIFAALDGLSVTITLSREQWGARNEELWNIVSVDLHLEAFDEKPLGKENCLHESVAWKFMSEISTLLVRWLSNTLEGTISLYVLGTVCPSQGRPSYIATLHTQMPNFSPFAGKWHHKF